MRAGGGRTDRWEIKGAAGSSDEERGVEER